MEIEFISADKSMYFTQSEAQGYYGIPRTLQTIVIHHWNAPSARPAFHQNLNYLLNNANGYPSANCVIGWDETQNRIRIIDTVQYPNVAFTSGGSINAKSIGIECDPWGEPNQPHQAEILKAIGFRVYKIREQHGWRVPLSKHSAWTATACPGDYDLNAIDNESDKWANGAYNPPKPPTPVPTPPPAIKFTRYAKPKVVVYDEAPTTLWIFNVDKWPDFKAQATFAKGNTAVIVGEAKHPLGGTYLMTSYSFGEADKTGIPPHYWGFNIKDVIDYVEPPVVVPPVVTPPPVVVPPVVTPPVVTPPVTEYPNWFIAFWVKLIDAIKGILGK